MEPNIVIIAADLPARRLRFLRRESEFLSWSAATSLRLSVTLLENQGVTIPCEMNHSLAYALSLSPGNAYDAVQYPKLLNRLVEGGQPIDSIQFQPRVSARFRCV